MLLAQKKYNESNFVKHPQIIKCTCMDSFMIGYRFHSIKQNSRTIFPSATESRTYMGQILVLKNEKSK